MQKIYKQLIDYFEIHIDDVQKFSLLMEVTLTEKHKFVRRWKQHNFSMIATILLSFL
jgi:hypothetical protein